MSNIHGPKLFGTSKTTYLYRIIFQNKKQNNYFLKQKSNWDVYLYLKNKLLHIFNAINLCL